MMFGTRNFGAEENKGEPVDDLALMKRAYTNKKTGQIDDGLVRDVVDLVQTQVYDEVSQLQTDDDDSTASTNLSRVRINEIVESSVPKKKGRMVGLGRRSRSAAPSSAPPPYVDPEVLTAQLKDKDDRISALETQMAAQQAGYETQKRLNEQMMEMMKRMYPNEVFPNIQDPSASAQIFADMVLCPFEAIKVRVQTQPMFANGLLDGFPKVNRHEASTWDFFRSGVAIFHVILLHQLDFILLVEFIYQNIIEKRKQDCSKAQQLGVTCLAGYTAGALGTLISDPADVVVSSHYNNKAKNVLQAVINIGFVGLFTRSFPVRITIVGP
ncbi:hypothetical protein IGI04_025728, partial [Brassica rapa subsp. trilocularis]